MQVYYCILYVWQLCTTTAAAALLSSLKEGLTCKLKYKCHEIKDDKSIPYIYGSTQQYVVSCTTIKNMHM